MMRKGPHAREGDEGRGKKEALRSTEYGVHHTDDWTGQRAREQESIYVISLAMIGPSSAAETTIARRQKKMGDRRASQDSE